PRFSWCLERVVVDFAGPYTDDLVDGGDEDLPVADLPSPGAVGDRFHDRFGHLAAHRDFDFDLREKIHRVLRAAVDFRVPFLPAVTLDFADRHALHAKRRQRFANLIELERLDDGRDEFHADPLFALEISGWTAIAVAKAGIKNRAVLEKPV